MTTLQTNRRAFDVIAWTLAGLALVILITSACSPYGPVVAVRPQRETPTPSATATAELLLRGNNLTTELYTRVYNLAPLPYWQLAAQRVPRQLINPAQVTGGKIGY